MIGTETRKEMESFRIEASRLALKNDVLQDDGVSQVLYHIQNLLTKVLNRLDGQNETL